MRPHATLGTKDKQATSLWQSLLTSTRMDFFIGIDASSPVILFHCPSPTKYLAVTYKTWLLFSLPSPASAVSFRFSFSFAKIHVCELCRASVIFLTNVMRKSDFLRFADCTLVQKQAILINYWAYTRLDSIYIYILTYIAPLQGNYSEALPGPAKEERLEEFIERTGKVPRITR